MSNLLPVVKPLNFNLAQFRTVLNTSKLQVDVWGRATGKSTNKAWRYHRMIESMPRSTHIISGATFQQILTRTLPATFEAMERLGYEKDIHYVVGKEPPKYWKRPYQQPLHYERFISFINGTGFHLSSQDREGMARGYNVDSVDADEALTLDKKKFEDEAVAANRGNLEVYKGNSLHHGISISTSMPTTAKSKWLLELSQYYEEDGNGIWLIWNRLTRLQLQFIDSENNAEKEELLTEIEETYKSLKFYKSKEGVFFSLANVFDNLKNVGWDYIKQMRRQMTTIAFRTEILNEKLDSVEDCFYRLDEERHFYSNFNYHHLDSLKYDFEKLKRTDCRQDLDLLPHLPIDLVIDYGASINASWVGQSYSDKEYRFLKTLFVKYPEGLKDLIDQFDGYYHSHQQHNKDILLWHDHTAVGRDAVRQPYIIETEKYLRDKGWNVLKQYIGQAPLHSDKYLLWELILRSDERFPKVWFNRHNCKDGILSMQLAGVRQGKNGFEKDKRSEQNKNIPREQATDFSEAADIVIWGRYSMRLSPNRRFIDGMMLK